MKKRSMPKEHPVAWASQLWPHLELIRSMRRQRKKWAEIADHLEREHSVKVTFRTVRNFFKRATDPKRKSPLGVPQHSTPPTPDQLTETEIHAKKETNEN